MEEWSGIPVSPDRMWKELEEMDPMLDQNKFKTSDGRNWDIARLNNAYKVIKLEKQQLLNQALKKQDEMQMVQFEKQQQVAWQQQQLKQTPQVKLAIIEMDSKNINLKFYEIGFVVYLIALAIEVVLLFTIVGGDNVLMQGERFMKALPFFAICLLVQLVSIPMMTGGLGKAVGVLDKRTQ